MRQLLQCRSIKSVSYGLILALLSTIVPSPFVKHAHAQLMPTYSVGVADFLNESGVQGDALARLATDAVVVEMSKTNRYDVNTTRTRIKAEMDKLSLRAPLDRLGLVRLGEALDVDAMLEGSIKSVQLAGSGPTRTASVTMIVRMVDGASGELINGAVQTGSSSARVGYTSDDESLISEAVGNAAFLAVKTMVDYVIPEATVQMNIGENQVLLNKGAREGLKPGMRMIVLRQKEIIGYIETRDVTPQDTIAKVTKSMRGINAEDKARAIFEMPTVGAAEKTAPMPNGAPPGTGGGRSSMSKIGKFILGAAIVVGIAMLFRGGRGNESAPSSSALATTTGIPGIAWDATAFEHGKDVVELQVLRVDVSQSVPVKVVDGAAGWDLGYTRLDGIYGATAAAAVAYHVLDNSPTTNAPTVANGVVPIEGYGNTHTYQVRVVYDILKASSTASSSSSSSTSTTSSSTSTSTAGTYQYMYSSVGAQIVATAIDPVHNADVISPQYNSLADPPGLVISDIKDTSSFTWNTKTGADVYKVIVEPVVPGAAGTWQSSVVYAQGITCTLSASDKNALANMLLNTAQSGATLKWTVYCRHQADSNQAWVQGDTNMFKLSATPPANP